MVAANLLAGLNAIAYRDTPLPLMAIGLIAVLSAWYRDLSLPAPLGRRTQDRLPEHPGCANLLISVPVPTGGG